MIINFCKKSVHSFLGLSAPNITDTTKTRCQPNGLTLITAAQDIHHPPPPNVLESATVNSRKDTGGLGFLDDIGGSVDGLMSCTESLGFESSDERRVDDLDNGDWEAKSTVRGKWRRSPERKAVKKFPPPISSLNQHGQPSYFLRPVRKDGRFALTEVRIDRPEMLRACREDGRLRLHLIEDEEEEEIEEEEEEEEEEEKKKEEEEEVSGEWRFPVDGEGLGRCNEVENHDHRHGWRQQHCVSSR